MDYTSEGVASAYWEIARELKFWKGPFSAHLEYNGGLAKEFSYNNAYLAGATYTYNNASFSRGFTLTAMYKYIQKHPSPNNFQLTGTWYMNFCKDLLTFSGFVDWWCRAAFLAFAYRCVASSFSRIYNNTIKTSGIPREYSPVRIDVTSFYCLL